MTKKLKVVTIGGGSSYTPELVEGIINRYDILPITEYWLVDVEEGREKLEIVGNLAKRMIKAAGLPIEVHLTLDRREALKDADFVTTQIRVGQLKARALDERISLQNGVLGQETNGAGGLFKGLRTIPVILDICKDVEELCPDAWIINFSNPAGMVTEAVLKHSSIKKFIGLCNVPIGIEMGIAKLLEVDASRLRIDFAGLNHMVYGLDVFLDGVSVKDRVIEITSDPENSSFVKNVQGQGWEPEFIRSIGAILCPYHNYYYKAPEMLKKGLKGFETNETRAEVVQRLEDTLFEQYKDENLCIKPSELEKRGGSYYSDAACRLIASIYNDTKDIQPVNTINRGAITGLPYDSAVEVSSVITKNGPMPLAMGELPVSVRGLVQTIKTFEQLGVEAAVEGSRDKAILALATHPLIGSDILAKKIVDEMIEAHKEYLPQFK